MTAAVQDAVGAAQRMTGFMAQLRRNGFAVGPGETELALTIVAATDLADAAGTRLALKTMLSGDRPQWERFDALFDAFWFGRGVKTALRIESGGTTRRDDRRPRIWDKLLPADLGSAALGPLECVSGADADAPDGSGRIVATRSAALSRADLRNLTSPKEMEEAELVAERLARAIRYRLSRRRVPARRGDTMDLRRTIRRSISRGGEPMELLRRRRPERPVRLVVLLDVSGSMRLYSRYLVAFVRGLLGQWLQADAFLFHTRLIHISEVLRERDRGRAMDRLSLMVEGFGGGTLIAGSLRAFNDRFAKAALNSRSVVIIMSDGYDTDPPASLVAELVRLKRRARRLVWLNPLLGWRDYAPVARAMAAALPYIDCFATAHSLDSLAALEGELARL
jgi:uncharacterized protein with von Willebrand factor type A (vWA) domain